MVRYVTQNHQFLVCEGILQVDNLEVSQPGYERQHMSNAARECPLGRDVPVAPRRAVGVETEGLERGCLDGGDAFIKADVTEVQLLQAGERDEPQHLSAVLDFVVVAELEDGGLLDERHVLLTPARVADALQELR